MLPITTAASLLMAMNQTMDPCQDFFQFACGTWNKKHLIPEDRSSISTFEVLADQLQIILKGIEGRHLFSRNSITLKLKQFVSHHVFFYIFFFVAPIDCL